MYPPQVRAVAVVLLSSLVGTAARAQADGGQELPVVAIVPLGEVDPSHLEAVSRAILDRLEVTTRVEARRPLPKEAFYPPRKRWRAEKLLEAVDTSLPSGAWKVVAVTAAEISTTKGDIHDWGIAGLGSIDGPSCVVSTHLYRKHSKTREALLRRLTDLAVHELGHTLGLDHCPTARCVMRDAQGKAIKSADESSTRFCARCRARLRPGLLKG